jgi:hypothetical protein
MTNQVFQKEIVYGGSFEALLFAYLNDFFFVPDRDLRPNHLEFIPPDISRKFGFKEIISLKTSDGEREMGCMTLDVWARLLFNLAVDGHALTSKDIYSIRLNESSLKVIHSRPYYVDIHFDKIHIFTEQNLTGLPFPVIEEEKIYRVWDWIEIRQGLFSDLEYFNDLSGHFEEVFLYPSERFDGFHKRRRDICAVSLIKEGEMKNFESSDSYSRLILERILNEVPGIRNPLREIRLECFTRDERLITRDFYSNTDKYIFHYETIEDIAHEHAEQEILPGRYHTRRRTKTKF